jgi:large subunit ribosomal protein L9
MQIILLEKVQNLGRLGDTVKVKPGYARNFLIPKGKAIPATEENRQAFEARRAELERQESDTLSRAESRRDRIEALGALPIAAHAGTEGKLFGSVGPEEIAAALGEMGVEVDRREVRLDHGPLRNVGDHEVAVHLHPDVDATLTISVVPTE